MLVGHNALMMLELDNMGPCNQLMAPAARPEKQHLAPHAETAVPAQLAKVGAVGFERRVQIPSQSAEVCPHRVSQASLPRASCINEKLEPAAFDAGNLSIKHIYVSTKGRFD